MDLNQEQRRDVAAWVRTRAEAVLEASDAFYRDPTEANAAEVIFYARSVLNLSQSFCHTTALAVQRSLL